MSVAFFAQGTNTIGCTLASEIAALRMMGLSGSVFGFFPNLGGATVPIVVGTILDLTGSFNRTLLFVAALAVVELLAYLVLIDEVDRLEPRSAVRAPTAPVQEVR
ncbi:MULTISPECIES: hypothetical protein [unclassified Saccharopolyspora]|uniref:hypothetical protein n=1 Tax=unclassified Saccharopolyspora TaxID=2646250 RepID=UPI001CD4F4E1|nr:MULTISPECIES: hypothetical protein [unclassified Saccharopolyspora]MCA1188973.1 hypothetical protein [Saccharopolyspora sp. 6T]MCA1194851.1 hypothetical protein [Saccharopolyspora sp. 6V]MCA1282240.1 hypothetical protein [Saccharopolyspora sp. 7B]